MKAVTNLVLLLVLVGVILAQEEIASVSAPSCALSCPFGMTFNYPHLQDCNRFYRCLNGRLLEFRCSTGQIFDMATLSCQTAGRCVLPAL